MSRSSGFKAHDSPGVPGPRTGRLEIVYSGANARVRDRNQDVAFL